MFVWSVAAFEKAIREHQPPLGEMIDHMQPVVGTDVFNQHMREEYEKLEKISIDYAMMEKADNIIMCRGTFPWDDVGSWPALEKYLPGDDRDNHIRGTCESCDANNNLVFSEGRLTALVGVKDLIVVQTEDVTLVCPKSKAQEIKHMVVTLRESGKYDEVL